MKKNVSTPHIIHSVSELHQLFQLSKPNHPSISVINFELLNYNHSEIWKHFSNDFYCIVLKKGSNANFKYGQQNYDFDKGIMSFTKPSQVFSVKTLNDNPVKGFMLVFNKDLITSYPLGKNISLYSFFNYSVAEALNLSEKEEKIMSTLLLQIQDELKINIDNFSQDIIVSYLELLLSYSNRFYNRQFITRKVVNTDLLSQLELLLENYFNTKNSLQKGLPSVQFVAEQLNLSADYLSDLVRNFTGKNTQQYIQDILIEKAKEFLTTSRMSVGEISYLLGFEYPQSFSKLFKKRTQQTPLEYRNSFN